MICQCAVSYMYRCRNEAGPDGLCGPCHEPHDGRLHIGEEPTYDEPGIN